MARVPVMQFCEPTYPPPTVTTEGILRAVQKAQARFSLVGKCTVISGGARGLGLTIAEGFLEHDATAVALLDLDEKEGQKALNCLHALFPDKAEKIVFHSVDVTDATALGKMMNGVAEAFGNIDVLVCFAGLVNSTRAIDYTAQGFREICDVNTNVVREDAYGKDGQKRGADWPCGASC